MSILFRLGPGEADPEHPFSEVFGVLQRVSSTGDGAQTLHVCRRDGSLVAVAEADIVRLKFVPTRHH